MKFNFLKDKSGVPIGLKTFEQGVFDKRGRNLVDKITSINSKILYIQDSMMTINARIENMKTPIVENELEVALRDVIIREDSESNICLLSDNNGVVTSEYGYNYKILAGLLYDGNYSEYIKDGDWIEMSTPDGGTYKMYANIDTYYGEGEDDDHKIGHHIDFISDNLIYGSTSRTNGSDNYSATDINSWRMNNDTTYSTNGNNNGVASETSPFLANSTEHRSSEGGIIDKLNTYYDSNISSSLKSYIIKKYHKVPTRYQSGAGLTDDNGSKWAEMPYLWIPYYTEVFGNVASSYPPSLTYESHMKQYNSFRSNSNFGTKIDKKDSKDSAWYWWTASARSGFNTAYCMVYSNGSSASNNAYYWNTGAPLCFRFGAKFYTNQPVIRPDLEANICLLKDDNGKISSDYNYTYDFLADVLDSGEYDAYIKDGDWLELSTPDGGTYKMYANVDTYYGEGESGKEIGHHIDFISDNLIYGSTSRTNGKDDYTSTNINSWRMNYDTTYTTYGSNNGVATETSPFLANSTEHRGAEGGIIDKLNNYYSANISESLKAHIIKKYHKVSTRYQSGSSLKDDNGSKWAEMPYLWIPYYKEVWGGTSNTNMATTTYESHMKQYHSFSSNSNFKIKGDKKDTSTSYIWWLASARSGYFGEFCIVNGSGGAGYGNAYTWTYGSPLCFRFQ